LSKINLIKKLSQFGESFQLPTMSTLILIRLFGGGGSSGPIKTLTDLAGMKNSFLGKAVSIVILDEDNPIR